MKLSKIALATAALAAIASGSAFAGQIGSSSLTVATEVVYSDAQKLRAPSIVYAFAGDIDARTNTQLLQLQYQLTTGGTWALAAGNQALPGTALTPAIPAAGDSSMLKVSYINGTNTALTAGQNITSNGLPKGSTVNVFTSADKKQLIFNVTIPAATGIAGSVAADYFLKAPSFTVNADANTVGNPLNNAEVNGMFTVAGAATCPSPDKNADLTFKHFTTNNGQTTTDILTAATPGSEHLRPSASNDARLISFVQNHVLAFTPAISNSRQNPATGNTTLSGTNVPVAVVAGAAGTTVGFTPLATAALAGGRHYLGKLQATQRAQGRDTNYANIYGDAGTPGDNNFLGLADTALTAGTVQDGSVEYGDASITITFPTGLPLNSSVSLATANGAALAGGLAPIVATAGQTVFTFKAVTAADIASVTQQAHPQGAAVPPSPTPGNGFAGGVYAYLDLPGGAAVIPQLAGVTAVGQLNKNTAGTFREQSVSCPGTLAGIGGGIKIDIRNYASAAKFPGAGNFASYVRLINNSESVTADIYAQLIYADGTYGPYGQLPSLLPRAVANYSNAALEAYLITTPAVNNPFGTSTAYTQTAGASVVNRGVAGTGDRVRFVSVSGTTLRVQSYMLLPGGTLLDTTSAQGVDFENTQATPQNSRTAAGSEDAQSVSQDAINGLAR